MAGPTTTIRLASGIFYKPPQLNRAVDDLLASGFGRHELCLAGTRDALASARTVSAGSPRRLRPLYPLPDGTEVMGTSGVLLRKLLKETAWRERESALHSAWLLPELFGKFSDHIRGNAVVLMVSAREPGLLQTGSRVLLRHSAHPVQTHEFTLARATGSRTGLAQGEG
jgi:hypothetical protein